MDDLHSTTQSLIQDIEKKDRRFRLAQSIFMAAALVGLALAVVLGYTILTKTQHDITAHQAQVSTLQSQIKRADKDNAIKLQDLQHHIDCIVTLFGQPNRAQLSITDISNCQITATGSNSGVNTQPAPGSNAIKTTPPTTVSPSKTPSAPAPTAQQNVPAPAPHPLVCSVTLGLLGCK